MLESALQWPVEATIVFCCLWARCTVMLGIAHVFGLVGNSRGLRVIVATILAAWLWPAAFHAPDLALEDATQFRIALLMAKEGAVGLFLGILLSIPVWVAESVGAMFDNHRGAMTGQTFNPLLTSPSTMALLLQYAAVLALYGSGALTWVFEFLVLVARLWPPESLTPNAGLADLDMLILSFNAMAKGAVLYFAPLMAIMLMIEAGMSLMSLYAPHLQAFQLAMPVKSLVGLGVLLMLVGTIGEFWMAESLGHFRGLVERARAVLHVR
ncbi:EscT/YscT/HrcT family type III secretion system export apparatus protein [Variovorax sp. RHLX14]|uniref:EscT/YscT/HrcT family type III secretion system export apparatus protein n=1 Tax=Variovorax sp. RHLX14 TaxID=1259731 RepID=UPI003F448E3E